ncbi:MAG: hypothetical protein IPF99_35100 [Deltaproteobacteria bacterium]|nr:hypothetical protein [Deltaproteobacteria bacterium]
MLAGRRGPPRRRICRRPQEPALGARAQAELGFPAVGRHFIQLGRDGSRVDYRDDAAQTNLYTFRALPSRSTCALKHLFTFLHQPLQIDSTDALARPAHRRRHLRGRDADAGAVRVPVLPRGVGV